MVALLSIQCWANALLSYFRISKIKGYTFMIRLRLDFTKFYWFLGEWNSIDLVKDWLKRKSSEHKHVIYNPLKDLHKTTPSSQFKIEEKHCERN